MTEIIDVIPQTMKMTAIKTKDYKKNYIGNIILWLLDLQVRLERIIIITQVMKKTGRNGRKDHVGSEAIHIVELQERKETMKVIHLVIKNTVRNIRNYKKTHIRSLTFP